MLKPQPDVFFPFLVLDQTPHAFLDLLERRYPGFSFFRQRYHMEPLFVSIHSQSAHVASEGKVHQGGDLPADAGNEAAFCKKVGVAKGPVLGRRRPGKALFLGRIPEPFGLLTGLCQRIFPGLDLEQNMSGPDFLGIALATAFLQFDDMPPKAGKDRIGDLSYF